MKFKRIIIASVVLALIGTSISVYMYNKPRKNLSKVRAHYSLAVGNLVKEFVANEEAANVKYLGKVLEVRGVVIQQESEGSTVLVFEGWDISGLRAELESVPNQVANKVGQQVTVKGKCTGMLLDVILVECVIINE